MGYICLNTTFRQLKHFLKQIYLTLLSATCMKIRQIPYHIFEAISQCFNVWPKKGIVELSFMTLKSDSKLVEKLTCGLENDIRNMAHFHPSTWKSENWNFDRIDLTQSRKRMSLKFTEELCIMTMKNDAKHEERLTCHFKIDIIILNKFWSRHLIVSKKNSFQCAPFEQNIYCLN